jgi:hypothetical protein
MGGACQPFVFVSAAGANLVRASDHNVAYSTSMTLPTPTGGAGEVALYACPDGACSAAISLFFTVPLDPTLDAGMTPTFHSYVPLAFELESAKVYFVNLHADGSQGELLVCPASGCTSATVLSEIGPSPAAHRVVRSDGQSVYWSDGSATISRCEVGGCAAPATFFAGDAGGAELVNDLAVDGTSVYWTTGTGVHKCAAIPQGSTATCTAPSLLTGVPSGSGGGAFALAVDAANVYWVDTAGRIDACPIGGCLGPPTVLATMQLDTPELASDGESLYWIAHDEGEVRTCATHGCGRMPRTLAFGQTTPTSIAVNTHAIYWATSTGIGKLAK